jgi:hypothetical protein
MLSFIQFFRGEMKKKPLQDMVAGSLANSVKWNIWFFSQPGYFQRTIQLGSRNKGCERRSQPLFSVSFRELCKFYFIYRFRSILKRTLR